jgi:hypothetical protein
MFKLKYEFSRKWSDLDGEAQLSPIVMESDATFTELVPVEIEEIRVDPSVEIFILALSAFVIASGVLFTMWTTINHKTKIIRRSQPEFLYILGTGCILIGFFPHLRPAKLLGCYMRFDVVSIITPNRVLIFFC